MAFYLVQYLEDNIYHVCHGNSIKKKDAGVLARWLDGRWYFAKIIAKSNLKQVLESIKYNLINNLPRVILSQIDCNSSGNEIDIEGSLNCEYSDENVSPENSDADPQYFPEYLSSEDDETLNVPEARRICRICDQYTDDLNNHLLNDHDLVSSVQISQDSNLGYSSEISNPVVTKPPIQSKDILVKRVDSYIPPENETEINLVVPPSNVTKKYFCVFCKNLYAKLPTHLERAHKEEVEVRKFSILPKGCEERRKLIDILRKKGSFHFNTDKDLNKGHLIVERRPTNNKRKLPTDYRVCPQCKSMFSKLSIRKHYAKCIPNHKKGDRFPTLMGRRVHGQIHKNACAVLRDIIFPVLREDDVTRVIRYDCLVITYGNALCAKYRLQHLHKMIRSKLRLLGRFLIEMKHIDKSINDLSSVYSPEKFDNVISAVNNVAGLNPITQEYQSPSTASDLGTTLKKCGKLLVTLCIKYRNEKQKLEVEDFLKILEEEFPIHVNKTVTETQLQNKRKKKLLLPSTQDVSLFYNFVEKTRQRLHDELKKEFSFKIWKELASFTLISLQVFNRRRAGEVERITIDDFATYQSINKNDDPHLYDFVPEEFQANADKYVRFVVRGKKARGVPVLLSKEVFHSIKLMLHYREEAGVPPDNKYLFGIPGNNTQAAHLSACELMRNISQQSNVQNPKLLRGTHLRKHLATQSALLNLNDNEVNDLANFMGHAEKIHREHYRLPVVAREIGRVSRLLEMGLSNGTVGDTVPSTSKSNYANSGVEECHDVLQLNINDKSEAMEKRKSSNNQSEDDCDIHKDSWNENSANGSTEFGRERCVSPYIVKRRSWKSQEKILAKQIFQRHIEDSSVPSITECVQAINDYSVLQSRSPAQLKSWVSNQIRLKDNLKIPRAYWNEEEKSVMRKAFEKNIKNEILPGLKYCTEVKNQFEVLKNRNPTSMKAWVNNEIKRNKK